MLHSRVEHEESEKYAHPPTANLLLRTVTKEPSYLFFYALCFPLSAMVKSLQGQLLVSNSPAGRRLQGASPVQSGPLTPVVSFEESHGDFVKKDPNRMKEQKKQFDLEKASVVGRRIIVKELELSQDKSTSQLIDDRSSVHIRRVEETKSSQFKLDPACCVTDSVSKLCLKAGLIAKRTSEKIAAGTSENTLLPSKTDPRQGSHSYF